MAKFFFGDGGSQNMFVYQPTLDTLELQKEKGNGYVLSWKSKGLYPFELEPLYTAFLHSLKFDKKPLAVVQNSYVTKIVNSYFVYDLDIW